MSKHKDRRGQFDVTGIDLGLIIKEAFRRSIPKGLGIFQHRDEELTDAEVKHILDQANEHQCDSIVLHLDYVRGRAVKLTVWKADDDRRWIDLDWYDHTNSDTGNLMRAIGLPDADAQFFRAVIERVQQRDEWDDAAAEEADNG